MSDLQSGAPTFPHKGLSHLRRLPAQDALTENVRVFYSFGSSSSWTFSPRHAAHSKELSSNSQRKHLSILERPVSLFRLSFHVFNSFLTGILKFLPIHIFESKKADLKSISRNLKCSRPTSSWDFGFQKFHIPAVGYRNQDGRIRRNRRFS